LAIRRRPVKREPRTWSATQAAEKERVDRLNLSQKLIRQDFLDNILAHGLDMISRNKSKQNKRLKLGRAIMNYHTILQKEYQRKTDRYSKERLAALKNNDEEAYLKLIDEAKDTRITHLLRQTDVYLESLAKAVIAQQNEFQQFAPYNNIVRPNDTIVSTSNNQSFLNNVISSTSTDNRIQSVNGTIETARNSDATRSNDNSMKISNLLSNDTMINETNNVEKKNLDENDYVPDRLDGSNIAATANNNIISRSNDNISKRLDNSSTAVEDEDNIIQTTVRFNLAKLIIIPS